MSNWNLENQNTLPTRDEYVADVLREAILQGDLTPGTKLNQDEIATKLNVSRSPVRRALKLLTAEGLVETPAHRTARVASMSNHELEEIYQMRSLLEGLAARLAAAVIDADGIDELSDILNKMELAKDRDEWLDLNDQFHFKLYRSAKRERLVSMIQTLRNIASPYIRQYIASTEHKKVAREQHFQLLEACRRSDGLAAEAIIQEHITVSGEHTLAFFAAQSTPLEE